MGRASAKPSIDQAVKPPRVIQGSRNHIPRSAGPRLYTRAVQTPVAGLYRRAASTSPMETQLLFGERFHVYQERGAWVWGQSVSPVKGSPYKGYVGYVRRTALAEVSGRVTGHVLTLKAPVFAKPDIKSRVLHVLPLGAPLRGGAKTGDFTVLKTGGFMHNRHIQLVNAAPPEPDFVSVAEQHLGLPYIWGGVSSDGLDCSGLVLSALRATGQDAPRDTDQQEAALGEALPVRLSGLKRGDLVFWTGHVAIMQSARRIIHANAFHMCVETEPLKTAVARIQASSGPVTAIKRL